MHSYELESITRRHVWRSRSRSNMLAICTFHMLLSTFHGENSHLFSQDITFANLTDLKNLRELFFPSSSSPPIDSSVYLPRHCPCSAVHPPFTSCMSVPLDRFFAVFKWMLPIYSVLHFAPAILFKWQGFMQDPRKVLARAGFGSMRSSAFLGVFVVIYQCKRSTLSLNSN